VLVKKSFALAGHRTSVALEAPFWDVLAAVAAARGVTLAALVASVDAARGADQNLASSLRVLALRAAGERISPGVNL
jgi:predicted DNA-binding ribbon-helix-helix protein